MQAILPPRILLEKDLVLADLTSDKILPFCIRRLKSKVLRNVLLEIPTD